MLILGIILFGMLIGAAAQLIVGRSAKGVDWGLALAAGLVGSFIGGLVVSLRYPEMVWSSGRAELSVRSQARSS